jgi:hypothetical protein
LPGRPAAKRKCLVCRGPIPQVDVGRPRLYCGRDCKRRADGAEREIPRLRILIADWSHIAPGRCDGWRAEIKQLERIIAARHELIPRTESIGVAIRDLRALAGRMRTDGSAHVDELEAIVAGMVL